MLFKKLSQYISYHIDVHKQVVYRIFHYLKFIQGRVDFFFANQCNIHKEYYLKINNKRNKLYQKSSQ